MLRAGHSAWHTERKKERSGAGGGEEAERERGHLDEESKFTERKAASSVKAHGSRPSRAQTALTTSSNRGQRLKTAEHKGGTWCLPPGWVCFVEGKRDSTGGGGEMAKQGAETGKGAGEHNSSGRGPEVWILLTRPKQESLASADKPRLEREGDNCRPWAGLGAADGQIQRPCGVGVGG